MAGENRGIVEYLEVGCAAVLHPSPDRTDNLRYRTVIRGWREGAYVLFDMPDEELHCVPNQACVIRFLVRGEACGFSTRIAAWGTKAKRYFHVLWPPSIQAVGFRKFERVECSIPCTLTTDEGKTLEGEVRDMSRGGVAIWLKTKLNTSGRVRVAFRLPDGARVEGAPCTVRSVHPMQGGALHGCEIDEDAPDDLRESIGFFVSTTLERMHPPQAFGHRVVFIEQDDDRIKTLREALENQGVETAVARGIVDGFFRLRTALPSVLLISGDLDEMAPGELCRIVKNTPGLDSLSMFVYGGEGADVEATVKEAGAEHYFASVAVTEQIVSEVLLRMPDSGGEDDQEAETS